MKRTQGRGAQSHSKSSQSMLRHMHPLTIFFYMIVQKEFNFEIIFVPIVEHDFGYFVVNGIKCHLWLNAYFVKELN